MGFNFAAAARRIEAELDSGLGTGDSGQVSLTPLDRPTVHQPDVRTDGLDPATPGGPSPFNSGWGPYGLPVASDPLVEDPIRPGTSIPHQQAPDVDTTVLHHP